MSVQEFVCYRCDEWWYDKYSFWRGYQSSCPRCGKSRRAFRDVLENDEERVTDYIGFDVDGAVLEFEENGAEKNGGDLEVEPEHMHDSIAEALGSVEAETSDIDPGVEGADADAGDSAGADR